MASVFLPKNFTSFSHVVFGGEGVDDGAARIIEPMAELHYFGA